MLNIDRFFNKSPGYEAGLVKGDWYRVQWTPDISAGENLNLGVAFVSSSGSREIITIDDFSRLRCLYDGRAEYHAKLACHVAIALIEDEPDPEKWITPQLKIIKGGFAQGYNASEIICRLMDDLVPLSHPRGSGGGRHSPVRRKKAYTHIKENLESRLGRNYSKFIPENPRVKTGVGIDLYLPFRRGEGLSEAATLVSADYTSKEKIQGELYLGLRDVSLSREKAGFKNGSIFIVRPGGNMKRDVLRQAEEELREFALYLDSCNVDYYQGRELDELAEMVAEWIDEAAA